MSKRVAVMGFLLESNNFSPVTTENDYRKRCYLMGDEISQQLQSEGGKLPLEIRSFYQAMSEANSDWEMVPIVVADAEPGGAIDQDFFERTLQEIRGRLSDAGPLDGVYIASHGAMRATGDWDPDGTLYELVREKVGPDVPIIATLDLHTNVSDRMVGAADVLVSYLTNPHVDQRERAAEAAAIMREIWAGMSPQMYHIKVPIAAPTVTLLTAAGPYADLINYGQSQLDDVIANVSVTAGFIYSDSPKCGMSVIVTSRQDMEAAVSLANDIAARAWKDRERFKKQLTPLSTAAEKALMAGTNTSTPALIMADVADNPGGGGSGNTTSVLRAFDGLGVRGAFIGLMIDADVAKKAHEIGEGGSFTATFNAVPATQFDEPLEIDVTVERLTDGSFIGRRGLLNGRAIELGLCALLRARGILIGVATNRKQCADPMMIEQFGLDIAKLRTVVVKSRGHFRAGFDEFFPPERVLEIDCPGLTSPVLSNFEWVGLKRPIYPLDEETSWYGN